MEKKKDGFGPLKSFAAMNLKQKNTENTQQTGKDHFTYGWSPVKKNSFIFNFLFHKSHDKI